MPGKYVFCFYIYLPCLFLLCSKGTVNAQITRAIADNNTIEGYSYKYVDTYKVFLSDVANENTNLLDKKLQKQYSKIIIEKNTELLKQLNTKSFLFDTVAYPYLKSIFDHILQKNSLDKSRFHFFVDRTSNVNAYSYEDGTIVCDLGLVSIMENESQLAMVFCHELGHYLLKHVNNSIIKELDKYNSPEFLAHIKQIKKQGYNTKEQLEGLLMNDVFDRRRHNRSQEKAADSLAVLLYLNAGYNCKTVSHVFDLLDSAEYKTTVCSIQDFFKKERININEDALKPAKKMSFGAPVKKEIADSLKTHPDCAQRKITMQSFFDKNPRPGVNFLIGDTQKLVETKRIAFFDEAAYSKEKDNLGFYFFQLIQNNTLYPSNRHIKSEIFDTLLSICRHQKSHTLYAVLSNQYISDNDNDEYAKLLKLLDNISLQKMIEITNNYYQNNKSLIIASSEVINNFNRSKN